MNDVFFKLKEKTFKAKTDVVWQSGTHCSKNGLAITLCSMCKLLCTILAERAGRKCVEK